MAKRARKCPHCKTLLYGRPRECWFCGEVLTKAPKPRSALDKMIALEVEIKTTERASKDAYSSRQLGLGLELYEKADKLRQKLKKIKFNRYEKPLHEESSSSCADTKR